MMLEVLAGPRLDDDLLGFVEARLSLAMVDPKALVIVDIVGGAAPQPDDQTTFGDVVEDCDLLGQTDRMMKCRLHNRKADLALPRRRRQCAGKGDRVDIGAYAVEMMLGEPDHVDPELVGEPGLVQRLVDHDAVPFGIAAIREQEIAEFHRPSSSSGTPVGVSMRL